MKINGKKYVSVWKKDPEVTRDICDKIQIIDQRTLPHELIFEDLDSSEKIAIAIVEMHLRGAPLIGIVASFGFYFAFKESYSDLDEKFNLEKYRQNFIDRIERLRSTRPTAINLNWAIDLQLNLLKKNHDVSVGEILNQLYKNSFSILEEDIDLCHRIGQNGLKILRDLAEKKNGEVINILTHCNAGWLATGDYGTATAPMYLAHDEGIKIHVYVDETRPRNQGARLTAWELGQHGIPHTVISDNTGGHLMQHGLVDLCFVGADRVTKTGDAANKIGTYLKALAAKDNSVPFYVALPYSTFDFSISDGKSSIPIEQRGGEEVKYIQGKLDNGEVGRVLLTPEDSSAVNYGFDVTPARLITALITEKGICDATESGIQSLYHD